MDEAYQGYVASLAFGFSALLMWWLGLRFLDIISQYGPGSFKKYGVLDITKSDPRAAADYYGKRNIGAAIVVGLVLSAVRIGF